MWLTDYEPQGAICDCVPLSFFLLEVILGEGGDDTKQCATKVKRKKFELEKFTPADFIHLNALC